MNQLRKAWVKPAIMSLIDKNAKMPTMQPLQVTDVSACWTPAALWFLLLIALRACCAGERPRPDRPVRQAPQDRRHAERPGSGTPNRVIV